MAREPEVVAPDAIFPVGVPVDEARQVGLGESVGVRGACDKTNALLHDDDNEATLEKPHTVV